MQVDTILTQNVAHAAYKCGRNIKKNTWSKCIVLQRFIHKFFQSANSEFFSVLDTTFLNMITGAVSLEEVPNQRRSKKIGNGAETKGRKLDVLQRQRNKGVNG